MDVVASDVDDPVASDAGSVEVTVVVSTEVDPANVTVVMIVSVII